MKFDVRFRGDLIHSSVFLAFGAVVRGDVRIEAESSVWFNAVIRGDCEAVRIGRQTNIQDLCLLHADPGFACELADGVTVGHAAIVHGAKVEANCLIGMRAIIMNGARIGTGSLIAAGSIVTEGTVIPPGSLAMGAPARVKRALEDQDQQRIRRAASHYVQAARHYLENAAS